MSFYINVGLPQGSILRPTWNLIYINHLLNVISSQLCIDTDDKCPISKSDRFDKTKLAGDLENDLQSFENVMSFSRMWVSAPPHLNSGFLSIISNLFEAIKALLFTSIRTTSCATNNADFSQLGPNYYYS